MRYSFSDILFRRRVPLSQTRSFVEVLDHPILDDSRTQVMRSSEALPQVRRRRALKKSGLKFQAKERQHSRAEGKSRGDPGCMRNQGSTKGPLLRRHSRGR
jgi:hypothetical protein